MSLCRGTIMRMMKYLAYFLALFMVMDAPLVFAADDEPKSAADTRAEKKEATNWYKQKLARQKKALGALKKVKNDKTAKKAAASIMKHYEHLVGGKETAMGRSEAAEVPTGDAMDEAAEKMQKQLERMDTQIEKEIERINELELDCPELDKAIDAIQTY